MKLYFKNDEIIEKEFGEDLTGITNEEGQRPKYITLDEHEIEKLVDPYSAVVTERQKYYKYLQTMLVNTVNGKGQITMTVS